MKLALLNDTHMGARNSSEIFINYQERFYTEIFFPYLEVHQIKTVVHLGDYCEHRKYVNFRALASNKKHFLEELRKRGIKMHIIPGNHDIYYRNTLELNSLEELLGEYIADGTVIVYTKPTTVQFGSISMDLIPWLTPDSEEAAMHFLNESKSQYCGGHFEFTGFEMNPGQYCTDGMDIQWTKKFDGVYSGHFHTKNSQNNVHYLGSQFEFTWSDVNDKKYFHIFDTEKHTLTPVQNTITLYTKIMYDDRVYDFNLFNADSVKGKYVKIVVAPGGKTNSNMFESLIERIQLTEVHDLKISEPVSDLSADNIEIDGEFENTLSLAHAYIDNTDTMLDKAKLKQIISDLHSEAVSMEP